MRISPHYLIFFTVCLVGLGVRIGIMHLLIEHGRMGRGMWYIFASFLGIMAGTVFNFLGSKYIVFSNNLNKK
jgi:putative flippase GtrA